MVKKKKKKNVVENIKYSGDKNVLVENIGEQAEDNTMLHAMNTNILRQLPRVEDGLKTVERRILYAMYELNCAPNKATKKSGRIIGDTNGKYHPHGESSSYETMVRMAQSWGSHHPLIDGQGNFGSQSGKPAAAQRYTEARLSWYSWKCFFEDFNIKHVETRPNYTGTEPEPIYLPSKYPNILGNGSQFGIGMGTNVVIPHFNFTEVMMYTMKLMDDPNYFEILLPDSPTGADIVSNGEFERINREGKGTFKMRARIEINEEDHCLTVTALPIQTTIETLKERILKAHKDKKLVGLLDIANDSNDTEHGIRFHVYMRKEVDLYKLRAEFFSKMKLEKGIGVNIRAVENYQPNDYSVRDLLLRWIEIRRESKRLKLNHQILDYRERQHILEKILLVFDGKNAERSLKIIRSAENRNEIVEFLMRDFKITSLQAKTIADMRMSSFAKEGIRKAREEYSAIVDTIIPKLLKTLKSTKRVDAIIKKELEEGIEMFGQPRRSRIIDVDGNEGVRNTEHFVIITSEGMVKKIDRKAKSIGHINDGDYPQFINEVHNADSLLIFDEIGTMHKLPISDISNSLISSGGEPLNTYTRVSAKVCSVIVVKNGQEYKVSEDEEQTDYLLTITRNGTIKKTEMDTYSKIKGELMAAVVKDRDKLCQATVIRGNKDIIVYTKDGFGSRFNTKDIRPSNRMSIGVKAMAMDEDTHVMGMDVIDDNDQFMFVLTEKGFGKKCTLDSMPVELRNSKPYRLISLAAGDQIIHAKPVKGKEIFTIFKANSIEDIDLKDVESMTRMSKGKKLVGVKKGDNIIDIKIKK